MDYIFRWLALKFLPQDEQSEEEKSMANGLSSVQSAPEAGMPATNSRGYAPLQEDAPPCSDCGAIMVRAGACYRCHNCGATSGCG